MATARKGTTEASGDEQSPDAAVVAEQRQEVPVEAIDPEAEEGQGQFPGDPNTYPASEDDLPRSY